MPDNTAAPTTPYPWKGTLQLLAITAVGLAIAAIPPHIWLDVVLRVLAFILAGLVVLHGLLWLLAVALTALVGRMAR